MTTHDSAYADLADLLGTPPLDAEEQAAVLDLTRIVAHTRQRPLAPISVYALALTMTAADTPSDRLARLRAAITMLESDTPADQT